MFSLLGRVPSRGARSLCQLPVPFPADTMKKMPSIPLIQTPLPLPSRHNSGSPIVNDLGAEPDEDKADG